MHINEFYDISYGHSGCGCHNMFYNSDIKIRKFVYTDKKIRKINKMKINGAKMNRLPGRILPDLVHSKSINDIYSKTESISGDEVQPYPYAYIT